MESNNHQINVDFTVDQADLYREETYMDLKVAQIRQLVPVLPDGTADQSRNAVFVGYTKIMSPKGPVSLHCKMKAHNLEEAIKEFPAAMNQAVEEMANKS